MEGLIFLVLMIVFIGLLQDPKKTEKKDQSKRSKPNHNPYYDQDNKIDTSSSSSSSDYTYNNPSTGLPMTTSGTGGVDVSGTPYGH